MGGPRVGDGTQLKVNRLPAPGEEPALGSGKILYDLTGLDPTKLFRTRAEIEAVIPHRGVMSMIDGLVWASDDWTNGIGVKYIRDDEFWVPGHFPDKPMFPGVLMVETGAQLACFLYLIRKDMPSIVAFLRIEHAVFRAAVYPGDTLLILCRETKIQKRKFVSDVQGVVGDKIVFEAHISGLAVN